LGAELDDLWQRQYALFFMKLASRKLLLAILGVLIVGFLIYRSRGMLRLGGFSGAKLWESIRYANPFYLILSLIGIYVCYAIRALRWHVFQRNLGDVRYFPIYEMTLAGFAAVFLLGRAGEPIRPLLLARKAKHPVADIFGIWALERLFDLASTAVLAAAGLIVFTTHSLADQNAKNLQTASKTTGSFIALGVVVGILVLMYLRYHGRGVLERRLEGWRRGHGWRGSFARIVLGFVRGIQTIRSWKDLILSVVYSAAHWYLIVVIYFLVVHSFGGDLAKLSLSDNMIVLAFAMVGSAVQLPGVGGGSQVACFLAYTAIFGVEREPAAAAAILVWLITFASCSLAGIPLLIHEGISLGKLRELAKQEKEELAEIAATGLQESSRPGDAAE
jgi:glycosyltransferase 2 family protein